MEYFDHRGWPSVFPEHTLEAYRASVACGAKYVECDLYLLKDGSLGVMHDGTVDRTTSSSGNVLDYSAAGWSQLSVDAGSFLGPGWGNYRAPFAEDVVREFGNKQILILEVKGGGYPCCYALLALLTKYGIRKEMVLVNATDGGLLAPFIAAGYDTCLNLPVYNGTPSIASLVAVGYPWIAVDAATSTAQMDLLRAAGFKVAAYTVNTHEVANALEGHCDAIYTDCGAYMRRTAVIKSDPFGGQTYYHGHIPSNTVGQYSGRGIFTSPDKWGYDMAAANGWVGALQGWASPMWVTSVPSILTIDFTVTFNSAFNSTRLAWLAVTTTDHAFSLDAAQAPAQITGYTFIVRKSGEFSIDRYVAGVSTLFLSTGTSVAIADGGVANYRVTITPTSLKLERLDVAASCTTTDTSSRGAYLHAGVKGINGHFKDISITTTA